MKMINAGPVGPVSSNFGNYLFNCTRNKQCQRPYFIPAKSLSELVFYADLPGKPLTYQASIMDLCTPNCEGGTPGDFNFDYNYDFLIGEGCLPTGTDFVFNSYVAGKKPDGTWYGVFGAPSDVATPSFFFVRIVVNVDGVEYIFYSEMFEKDTCDTLTLVRGCYPNEPAGASATDCNGIYYGFPTNNDPLGSPNFRYIHSAYVRKASVIDADEKLTISLFNSRRPYKTTVTHGKVFEFELVPPFYKDHLLSIFARGVIQITQDGKTIEYKLQEEQTWSVLSRENKLWALDVLLGDVCKQIFGCSPSDCELPAGACGSAPDTLSVAQDGNNWLFTISGGSMSAGDRLEWTVKEGNVLIDSGIISASPWNFLIDGSIHTDFDPAVKCYSVEWKKVCADGTQSATQSDQYGNCNPVVGTCHTYLIEYTGAELTNITFKDCDNVHQEFQLFAQTSQRICALSGSIGSADMENTTITDEGEGCNIVECDEYYNNTQDPATGINYVSCEGVEVNDATVPPGGSICIQPGTGNGGDFGWLVRLGTCSAAGKKCYLYNVTCDSEQGAVVWYELCDAQGGQFFSFNLGFGEITDVCSRSVPYAEQGHIVIGQAPAECP